MCPWKFGEWYFQVKRALLRFLRISSASKALNDSDEDAKNPPIQHIFRWKITKNELPQNLLQIMLISPSFTSDRNWKFIFSIFDFFKHEINFESLKCSKFKDIKFISKILFFLSVQFYLCKYQDFFKFSPLKNKKKTRPPQVRLLFMKAEMVFWNLFLQVFQSFIQILQRHSVGSSEIEVSCKRVEHSFLHHVHKSALNFFLKYES